MHMAGKLQTSHFRVEDAIVCDFQLQAELLLIDLATLVIKVLESDDI